MSVSTKYLCNKCNYSISGYQAWLKEVSPILKKEKLVAVIDENHIDDHCPYCYEGILVEDPQRRTWFNEKDPRTGIKPIIPFPKYTAILKRKLVEALKQANNINENDKSTLVSFKKRSVNFSDTDATIDKLGEEIVVSEETKFLQKNGSVQHIRNIRWYAEYNDRKPYNILSYYPNGNEKYIKVITTLESDNTYPVILNREEVAFMEENTKKYFIYKLLSFDKKNKTTQLEVYRGADDINKRRLENSTHEAIIQSFITHDSDFSLINEEEEILTLDDYMEFVNSDTFLWSIRGLSERELIIFTRSLFLYERSKGIFSEDNPILKILELPVIKKSDEYISLLKWLISRNEEPYEEYLEKEEESIPVLQYDNDTTKKNLARDLVKHLENIGQIPKTGPEELEEYLDEKFPLAK